MTDENTTEVEAPEGEVAEQQAAAGLSIGDMVVLKQCLEVASARGGFRANEMQVVGTTYNKLAAFVSAAMPAQEADEETADEEATAEEA
jgi:hypothetical protein